MLHSLEILAAVVFYLAFHGFALWGRRNNRGSSKTGSQPARRTSSSSSDLKNSDAQNTVAQIQAQRKKLGLPPLENPALD
jgi:cytosine/uracil/thiamine/allantoin permease